MSPRANLRPDLPFIRDWSDLIRDMLGEHFDDDTFWATLDGETDAWDIVGHLLAQRIEAETFEAASRAAAETYNVRARRMAEKQRAMSRALGAILDATGQPSVAHPLATVTRTKGRACVDITDEASIPTQLCKVVKTPDKAAILAALQAGETIPGAEVRIGAPGIVVRCR